MSRVIIGQLAAALGRTGIWIWLWFSDGFFWSPCYYRTIKLFFYAYGTSGHDEQHILNFVAILSESGRFWPKQLQISDFLGNKVIFMQFYVILYLFAIFIDLIAKCKIFKFCFLIFMAYLMLIPLSFSWGRGGIYCLSSVVPLEMVDWGLYYRSVLSACVKPHGRQGCSSFHLNWKNY